MVRWRSGLAWVLLGLWLPPALVSCRKPEPIRVGFLGGLTGRAADLGGAGRNGAILAVEQRNAAGGVNGRPVELLVCDDAQDAETARSAVRDLLSAGVEAIVGPMTSSMAVATVPLVDASPGIFVSPTVTTTALSGLDDHFLRVISSTTVYAAKSARYQYEKVGSRRVAALCEQENRAYTESWLEDFRRVFEEQGGRVVRVERYTSGPDASLLDRARGVLSAEPDAVLVVTNAVDAAVFCQQLRKLAPRLPIVMSEWASTQRFSELAGAAAEGVILSQFVDRNDASPRYVSFLGAYLDRFGQEPGFAGLAGYDAATVVLDGLSSRGRGESLKEALLRIGRFSCAQQEVSLDRFGDADRRTFVTTVRAGRYVTVE